MLVDGGSEFLAYLESEGGHGGTELDLREAVAVLLAEAFKVIHGLQIILSTQSTGRGTGAGHNASDKGEVSERSYLFVRELVRMGADEDHRRSRGLAFDALQPVFDAVRDLVFFQVENDEVHRCRDT